MLPEWASQLASESDKPLEVKCLQSLVDLSDARDVVRAYRMLLESGHDGQVYNVGSGIGRLSGQVLTELQEIQHMLNSPVPARAIVELSSKQQTNPIAIIDKVRRDTGWQPEISWRQTLTDTMRYWQERAGSSESD